MTNSPPDDFTAELDRAEAVEAARQAAVSRPPRRPRPKSETALEAYAQKALRDEIEAVRHAPHGTQNDTLNVAAFNLGQLVGAGALDEGTVKHELWQAAVDCGHVQRDGQAMARGTLRSGFEDGKRQPRDLSDVGKKPYSSNGQAPITAEPKAKVKNNTFTRTLKMARMSRVESAVPQWVWEYDDIGRIQLGTLTMFTGRPGTGKSTATRHFAAQITRGELPGVWHGAPMNVAMVCLEEDIKHMVKPSLIAAGADMSRIFYPDIKFGTDEESIEGSLLARTDEAALTDALIDNEIAALFVDPIMSTFDANVNINQNNEVRAFLQPYVRMACQMNGIVVAVTHLNKSNNRDVLAAMNGSSAFGEVPRAVFGFMEKGRAEPERVMEQVKNNAGPLGSPMTYKLMETEVATDDGLSANMTRFEILGTSDITLADIVEGNIEGDGTTEISRAVQWLHNYLLIEQPASVAMTKKEARDQADISERTLQRARTRLGVKAVGAPLPDKPHRQAWCLPDYRSGP